MGPQSIALWDNFVVKFFCGKQISEIHSWQSRVEIEHYFVAYFTHIAAFEAL